MKSYDITILSIIIFVLTFILWNYNQNYERVFDTNYVDEVNLVGIVKKRADVVKTESIIFKKNDNYFSFDNPADKNDFYKEMQSWVMYDFRDGEANNSPQHNYQVEIIFPDAISLDILPSLFDMDEEAGDLPEWSFKRMYITLNQDESTLKIHFLSIDGRYKAQAEVNNAAKERSEERRVW